jgi:glycosyltransferase involved in cell wall biosynthesis
MANTLARVLIAHQSTIPHYRVRFYELLEQMRPPSWTFDVVFDTRESQKPTIYEESVDYRQFRFPILNTRTSRLLLAGRQLLWQHFIGRARKYDVIITDTHLSNLSYPAVSMLRLLGKKRVFWGHARDMNRPDAKGVKALSENLKSLYLRGCDGFFAYTQGSKRELEQMGFPVAKIAVLNNTIDTRAEREAYLRHKPERDIIRQHFGMSNKTVLLHVGRLREGKRIDFLLDAFAAVEQRFPGKYHLFIVGTGPDAPLVKEAEGRLGKAAITHFGSLTDRERLAPIFTASDLFVMPGYVGLAPLQAFCYDLPALVFDLCTHSPEWEYLNDKNSAILPLGTKAEELPGLLPGLMQRFVSADDRQAIYRSIEGYTIEAMVENFISGVNRVLAG